MFGRKIPLFKVFNFQISLDPSWFILAVLITWSLAVVVFPSYYPPEQHPELSTAHYWVMGAVGALGLFISIVLHELGHSLAARRVGMEMRGITLFIFGGVAEMSDEPPNAMAEFIMAIAGPIVSVALGVLFLGGAFLGTALEMSVATVGVVQWLGLINMILVGFNMVPAFPLDGGRVLRSLLWRWKKDLTWATKITAAIGGAFGVFLIVMGVLFFINGQFIGGVWWFILGMFLRGAAQSSYQRVLFRRELEGEPVSKFMRENPVTVSRSLSVREFVEDVVYRHQHKMYPVVDDGALEGCVTLSAIREIPREEWEERTVADAMKQCSSENTIEADADAMEALSRLNQTGSSRLVVVDQGRLAGVIALKDLMGFLSVKIDLEGE